MQTNNPAIQVNRVYKTLLINQFISHLWSQNITDAKYSICYVCCDVK